MGQLAFGQLLRAAHATSHHRPSSNDVLRIVFREVAIDTCQRSGNTGAAAQARNKTQEIKSVVYNTRYLNFHAFLSGERARPVLLTFGGAVSGIRDDMRNI